MEQPRNISANIPRNNLTKNSLSETWQSVLSQQSYMIMFTVPFLKEIAVHLSYSDKALSH